MKRAIAIHPVLFAMFPIISLVASNLGQIEETQALRALVVAAAGAGLLVVLLRFLFGSWARARLLSSFSLLVFFTYGHVYGLVKSISVGGMIVGRHRFLVPLAIAVIVIGGWWILGRMKDAGAAERFSGIVGSVALVMPVFSIAAYYLAPLRIDAGSSPVVPAGGPVVSATNEPQPDIYYIILDGYSRQDVLNDLYDFDNSGFLEYLERKGFYVAREARSNYMTTVASLASSFNMEYLDEVAAQVGVTSTNQRPLIEMIAHSRARSLLEARGYQMVAFESGWHPIQVTDAAIYLSPGAEHMTVGLPLWGLNEFEILLLRSTLLRPILDYLQARLLPEESPFEFPFIRHRDRILYTLATLEEIPTWDGDYFVYAHLIIPHPPFVFGPSGQAIQHRYEYSLHDADAFSGPQQEYIQRYGDQVTYLNNLLQGTLDGLLALSDPPPIIILQADHGAKAHMVWGDPDQTNMREAFSILSAYYLPENAAPALYPSVTPVNSFRILFDALFGTGLGTLPDESYFSDYERPYLFSNMTERALSD